MSCLYCKNPKKKHVTPHQATENDKCISFIVEDSFIVQTVKDNEIVMETNVDISNCPFCGEAVKPQTHHNIADTTDRATFKPAPTKISPDMEQLYFELEDKEHIFQIGIKTILECILFGVKENQLPNLPLTWYTEVCSRYDIPLSELFGENI